MDEIWQRLRHQDNALYQAMVGEIKRQQCSLELIASENFVDPVCQLLVGSVLTNKYAEGNVGKRYYGGCEQVDIAESLAIDRANQLFGSEYANVQPHSGSQANMAVYMSYLQPGDTVMAMDLAAGGHLTHGSPANFSGRLYRFVNYGVRSEDGYLDYQAIAKLAVQVKPKMIVAGASAYARTIDFKQFAAIAAEHQALLMVDMAHIAGLVAAGLHPNPVSVADFVTSTTHKTLRGPRGGIILAQAKHRKSLEPSVCPRIQGGPLMHVIAAKAWAFHQAAQPAFKTYQQQLLLNAQALATALIALGFDVITGGTDNHLVLLDLRAQKLTGKQAEAALETANIATNKNMIPNDPQKPWITSGLRLGTAAVTTRGMQPPDMAKIANHIAEALAHADEPAYLLQLRKQVASLLEQFPLYPEYHDLPAV